MTFTTETALKNYTKLMMLSIRRERKLSFFVCNAKRRQSDVGSSDSRRIKSDQRILGKTIAPILGASQWIFAWAKRGVQPLQLHAMASSIRRIGITCYTSLISFRLLLFYFMICGILKVTDLIANMVLYIVHIFGKHGLLYIPFLGLKMELYT